MPDSSTTAATPTAAASDFAAQLSISALLPVEQILWQQAAKNKKDILEIISVLAEKISDRQMTRNDVLREILQREKIGSTMLAEHIALPHIRSQKLAQPICIFTRLAAPILYNLNEDKIDTLIFLITPQVTATNDNSGDDDTASDANTSERAAAHNQQHHALLATISKLMLDEAFVDSLTDCADAAAVHKKIVRWEKQNAASLQAILDA